ncbi:MAG: hypothetical protein M3O46_05600 [Myxococcota bacterium]|nr:hypothetical protein [Myxococcota bacterium]
MTFTRASEPRVRLREDRRGLDVLVPQIRVVLSHLVDRGSSNQHPADVADSEAAFWEHGLAPEDVLVGCEPLLPRLEANELPLGVFGYTVKPNLKYWPELDSSRRSPSCHRSSDQGVQLSSIVDAELNPKQGDREEVDQVSEQERGAREDAVLHVLANAALVEPREGRNLGCAEGLGYGCH